jgi:hypothetical protein
MKLCCFGVVFWGRVVFERGNDDADADDADGVRVPPLFRQAHLLLLLWCVSGETAAAPNARRLAREGVVAVPPWWRLMASASESGLLGVERPIFALFLLFLLFLLVAPFPMLIRARGRREAHEHAGSALSWAGWCASGVRGERSFRCFSSFEKRELFSLFARRVVSA